MTKDKALKHCSQCRIEIPHIHFIRIKNKCIGCNKMELFKEIETRRQDFIKEYHGQLLMKEDIENYLSVLSILKEVDLILQFKTKEYYLEKILCKTLSDLDYEFDLIS